MKDKKVEKVRESKKERGDEIRTEIEREKEKEPFPTCVCTPVPLPIAHGTETPLMAPLPLPAYPALRRSAYKGVGSATFAGVGLRSCR